MPIRFPSACLTVLLCATSLVGAVAAPAYAETIRLAWDPSPSPSVEGYLVQVGTSSRNYSAIVDVTSSTSFVFDEAVAGQPYYFVVVAYGANGERSSPSAEIMGYSDAPPELDAPNDQTSEVGEFVSLQLDAIDEYGDVLTYGATGLPPGVVLQTSSGRISGAPTQVGDYRVSASATDGRLTDTVQFDWYVSDGAVQPSTLLSPSGVETSHRPTFAWAIAEGASSFQLVVDDASQDARIDRIVSPVEADCAADSACEIMAAVDLASGPAAWTIRTTYVNGQSVWSGSARFTVEGAPEPAPAVPPQTPTPAPPQTPTPTPGPQTPDPGPR